MTQANPQIYTEHMKTFYEAMTEQRSDGWYLTVTISAGDSYWTSRPVRLEAETAAEANAEARRQVTALVTTLTSVMDGR